MTSTDIAVRAPRTVETLDARIAKAKLMAEASILPPAYRKNPANILVAMEAADALDVSLMQAINGVHVIDGRMSLAAEFMRALILRDGHTFRIALLSEKGCRITAARREDPEALQTFDYTAEDARRAGLTTGNHTKHPKAMLLARCTSMTARALFADVIAGMGYTPDELADDAPAPAPRVANTARLLPAAASTPEADPAPAPVVVADEDGVVIEADVEDPPY